MLHFSEVGAVWIDCDTCDAFSDEERRPDFILLTISPNPGSIAWVIVEMKRKGDNARAIVEQLESGANKVQAGGTFDVDPRPTSLLPLVLTERGGVHTADHDVFRNRRIRHMGKRFPIVVKRCGTDLGSVLP